MSSPSCGGCGGTHAPGQCPKARPQQGPSRFASSTPQFTIGLTRPANIPTNITTNTGTGNVSGGGNVWSSAITSLHSTQPSQPHSALQFTQPLSVNNGLNALVTQFTRKHSKTSGTLFNQQSSNVVHFSQPAHSYSAKRKMPGVLTGELSYQVSPSSYAQVEAAVAAKRARADAELLSVKLSAGQQAVADAVARGVSVFFTGPAGTGKSFLLQYLIARLNRDTTFVTASTGLAAVNIAGQTIHSFAGIGLGRESKEKLVEALHVQGGARKRWRAAQTLIIDEVSMIDGELFDKLEYVARRIRGDARPFGGIQLILTGDFLQLPPVSKGGGAMFCFEASSWQNCVPVIIELDSVFRQRDESLVSILGQIRRGIVSDAAVKAFEACIHRKFDTSDGIEATRMYSRKMEVNEENTVRLDRLKTASITYTAFDRGTGAVVDALARNCPAPSTLTLKVGSQVMLLKNLDVPKGLVNGSRGVIIDFRSNGDDGNREWKKLHSESMWPLVRFTSGHELVIEPHTWEMLEKRKQVAARTQVPLILAWSLTVHKCFPAKDTRVLTDAGMAFLDEIEERERRGDTVLYGCYEKKSRKLVYRPGVLRLISDGSLPTKLIEITAAAAAEHWTPESGPYGCDDRYQSSEGEEEADGEITRFSRRLSLRVTADHTMFVQMGNARSRGTTDGVGWATVTVGGKQVVAEPSEIPASSLLSPCQCPAAQKDCLHRRACVRLPACAETGHAPLNTSIAATIQQRLGLSDTQFPIFIELFGFWLGDGTMAYRQSGRDGYNAVKFGQKKKSDRTWLRRNLAAVGLRESYLHTSVGKNGVEEFAINDPSWFAFFDETFGYKYKRSRCYQSLAAIDVSMQEMDEQDLASATMSAILSSSGSFSIDESKDDKVMSDCRDISDEDEDRVKLEDTGVKEEPLEKPRKVSIDHADMDDDDDNDDEPQPSRYTKSVKRLPRWVIMHLTQAQLQLVIRGLWRADGEWQRQNKTIYTSCSRFRDQLLQALLHCGYSAYARLTAKAGRVRKYSWHDQRVDKSFYSVAFVSSLSATEQRNYKTNQSTVDNWSVHWTEPTRAPGKDSCWPSLGRQESVKEVDYDPVRDGRIWCVTVNHPDHLIFAQRAERHGGVVTKQSRPIIVGQCQGMTLDRVELDLGSCFEVGQAYVALSRIRSFQSLSLVSFPRQVIRAHPKALQFYENLRLSKQQQQRDALAPLGGESRERFSASQSNHSADSQPVNMVLAQLSNVVAPSDSENRSFIANQSHTHAGNVSEVSGFVSAATLPRTSSVLQHTAAQRRLADRSQSVLAFSSSQSAVGMSQPGAPIERPSQPSPDDRGDIEVVDLRSDDEDMTVAPPAPMPVAAAVKPDPDSFDSLPPLMRPDESPLPPSLAPPTFPFFQARCSKHSAPLECQQEMTTIDSPLDSLVKHEHAVKSESSTSWSRVVRCVYRCACGCEFDVRWRESSS